jgi:hypothetical protein
LKCIDEVV